MLHFILDLFEDAVVKMAVEFPAYGQERAANELRKSGIIISGGGVRSVWMRHDLENFKKRFKALEEKFYNNQRSHSGKHCYGKTPMQAFTDSLYIANQKNLYNIQRTSDNSNPPVLAA